MKNLSLTFTFLLIFTTVNLLNAQYELPNKSFEEWMTLDNGNEMPVNWVSRDYVGDDHVYCKKETSNYDGEFSFSLHNYHPQPNFCASSFIELADFDPDFPDERGIDFVEKPTGLAFYFKYYHSNPNSILKPYAKIELKRWSDSLNYYEVIGSGQLKLADPIDEFTYAEIPVEYTSEDQPEKLFITFGNPCAPSDSIVLQVDYVGLLGLSSTSNNEITLIENLRAFPNPAVEYFQITSIAEGKLEVYNQIGQLKKTIQITEKGQIIPVNDLVNGSYYYQVKQKGQFKSYGKILVNH